MQRNLRRLLVELLAIVPGTTGMAAGRRGERVRDRRDVAGFPTSKWHAAVRWQQIANSTGWRAPAGDRGARGALGRYVIADSDELALLVEAREQDHRHAQQVCDTRASTRSERRDID